MNAHATWWSVPLIAVHSHLDSCFDSESAVISCQPLEIGIKSPTSFSSPPDKSLCAGCARWRLLIVKARRMVLLTAVCSWQSVRCFSAGTVESLQQIGYRLKENEVISWVHSDVKGSVWQEVLSCIAGLLVSPQLTDKCGWVRLSLARLSPSEDVGSVWGLALMCSAAPRFPVLSFLFLDSKQGLTSHCK